MVEKIGVQRTPGANPEMYKSDDYSVHLKGDNSVHKGADSLQTGKQTESEVAGNCWLPLRTECSERTLFTGKHASDL